MRNYFLFNFFQEVAEQAAWALGNLAADGAEFRTQIKQLGALPALVKLLKSSVC